MQAIRISKYNILATILICGIILTLPVFFGNQYLRINNDTTAHLRVFEAIKTGNASFLYFGQMITGYEIVSLEKITGIGIPVLFMWFNFFSLVIGGIITMIVIEKITKSKVVGIIGMFVITFGTGALMHLFWSGTIFNVVEMIIIFPLTLLAGYYFLQKRNILNFSLLIIMILLLLVYHPSFGIQINNLTAIGERIPQESKNLIINNSVVGSAILNLPVPNSLIISELPKGQGELAISPIFALLTFVGITNLFAMIIAYAVSIKNKILIPKTTKIIVITLTIVTLGFGILGFSGLTDFSSRAIINFSIVVNLLGLVIIGNLISKKYNGYKLINVIITVLMIIGTMPNLVDWIERFI